MVPLSSHEVPRVSRYSGSCRPVLGFVYGAFTLSGLMSHISSTTLNNTFRSPQPQHARTLVWAWSISLAATLDIEFSFFSSGYLDVSVHRVPSIRLCIYLTVLWVFHSGFPHSEIHGSLDICSFPWLIAAYYVFHRLLVPRHPPYALIV